MHLNLSKARVYNSFQQTLPLKGQGFTLIELLIVVGIIGVLLIITLSRIGNFGSQSDLDTTAQRIVSTLQIARNQTLASESGDVYGVHFESDKYVLFKGATYDLLDTANKENDISTTTISSITLLPSGADVVFDRVRGTTSNSGSVTLQLVADASKTKIIVINALGQTSLQQSTTTPTARVTDTRHLHLDFGWSMENSITMRLRFPDPPGPDVTEDIDIQANISPGKFRWEGEVVVNSSTQKLLIHTHLLDPTTFPYTILSVHRDRRENDNALEIEVDSTNVVTYDAAGVATVGSVTSMMQQ